ncbi:hypothetical protein JHK87_048381 [Glycine soja]|nr:hypothetical protein JHK87_048381 [Glycine soja]
MNGSPDNEQAKSEYKLHNIAECAKEASVSTTLVAPSGGRRTLVVLWSSDSILLLLLQDGHRRFRLQWSSLQGLPSLPLVAVRAFTHLFGMREINNDNLNQVATNDAQDDDFLISNDCVDLKTAPASDTGVSAGSHLKGAGVNYCGTEYDESLIDSECLEVSPIVGKNTDCDTIYSDDGAATCHPHAIESELLPVSSEGIECDRNDVSNNYAEHGDWMVAWDTFYERTYFYNI